jgi:hypothetical protein
MRTTPWCLAAVLWTLWTTPVTADEEPESTPEEPAPALVAPGDEVPSEPEPARLEPPLQDQPCLAEPVTLRRTGSHETLVLSLTDCAGEPWVQAIPALSAFAMPRARTKRAAPDPASQPVLLDPGLLQRLQRVASAYPGAAIEIVSGVRTRARGGSRHRDGHALDVFVEGVDNADLAELARGLPKTGVGYYPNSTFVHLDVRDESAYWVDRSGPGEAPSYVPKVDPTMLEPAPEPAAPEPAEPVLAAKPESAPAIESEQPDAASEPAAPEPESDDSALRSLADRALVVMNGALGRGATFDTALPSREVL